MYWISERKFTNKNSVLAIIGMSILVGAIAMSAQLVRAQAPPKVLDFKTIALVGWNLDCRVWTDGGATIYTYTFRNPAGAGGKAFDFIIAEMRAPNAHRGLHDEVAQAAALPAPLAGVIPVLFGARDVKPFQPDADHNYAWGVAGGVIPFVPAGPSSITLGFRDPNGHSPELRPFRVTGPGPAKSDTCWVPSSKDVGGQILGIDMATLFVAGAAANAYWVLPAIAGIVGVISAQLIRRRIARRT